MSEMNAGAGAGWCGQDPVDRQWKRNIGSGTGDV